MRITRFRLLAAVLAGALITSNIGADFLVVPVMADDGQQETVETPAPAETPSEAAQPETPAEAPSENSSNPSEETAASDTGAADLTAGDLISTDGSGAAVDAGAAEAGTVVTDPAVSTDPTQVLPEGQTTEGEAIADPEADPTLDPEAEEDPTKEKAEEEKQAETITITYTAGEGGQVSVSSESVNLNDEESRPQGSTASSTDKLRYAFTGWDNGVMDATLVPDKSALTGDVTYQAQFKKLHKYITVSYVAEEGGLLLPEGSEEKVKTWDEKDLDVLWTNTFNLKNVTAVAEEGYEFTGWISSKSGGTLISTEEELAKPELNENSESITYTAKFEKKTEESAKSEEQKVTIHFHAGEGGHIALTSDLNNGKTSLEQTVAADEKPQSVVAVADDGYQFAGWEKDGEVYSSDAEITVEAKEASYTATFEMEAVRDVKKLGAPAKAEEEEKEYITVTFNPTTDPDEPLDNITIEVEKDQAISDKLPVVPEIPGYTSKWVVSGTTDEVTAETVVTEPFTAVVDKGEKIIYTVTFVQEDGTKTTKTTDIDSGFAINDLPEVTPKTNKVGKWVYPGTTNEFTVGTVISENLTVNAYYEQNIFTVKYMVGDAQYEELTTATGTTIVLPSDPIKVGATFVGWFTEPNGQGTQYTAESKVYEDLTLYAYFADQVRVSFIVKDDAGEVISSKSQYFIDLTVGDKITTLPDDPFVEGKIFDHWENENNGDTVENGYTVTESFNAVAVFKTINTYELEAKYFYIKEDGSKYYIQTQVFDLTENDFVGGEYTITVPGFTIAYEITDKPTYYPSQPTITVTKDQFAYGEESHKYIYSVEDEYKAADAGYKVGHYLASLSGSEYELIKTVGKVGVKGSIVSPEINNFPYADYDHRDENVELTGDADQELKVYYTRRNFTLSYNVGEGSYIDAVTAPYGTEITLPTTASRSGFTFGGWYKDSACTQPAGESITLEDNTTLYAKWNPSQSDYKIVYMIENANDDGYSYLATVTKQAATGSSITMTAQTAGAYGTRPSDLDTTNFTFKDSTTETVRADGTTVVTVRYSRNVYTITWEGQDRRYYIGMFGGLHEYWEYNQGRATLTAKYGANISKLWQETFNDPYPNNAWNFSTSDNDAKFTSLDIMPSGNRNVYRWYYVTTKTQYLNYWLENYDTALGSKTYNGRSYGLLKGITSHYNWLEQSDYPEYAGYTKAGMVRSDNKTGYGNNNNGTFGNEDVTVDFYYNAQEYPLTFVNYNGTQIKTEQVTLNADISNYVEENIPDAPMEGAEWLGWFIDAEHMEPYSGGNKMPAGLVLYGNFKFPTRTVTYDSQGGTTVEPETDEYGFLAHKPDDPEKEHFTFQGWFTATDEIGSPYDWNKPVTEDITLYARWAQDTIGYTVHYYENGTTDSVLPDKVVSDPTFKEGQVITEEAPTVANHVVNKASDTVTLSFNEEENVITFYYSEVPNELEYTVDYVLKDHPLIHVAESKTVTVNGTTTQVMEMAVEVDKAYLSTQTSDQEILSRKYKPVETTKELQLALTGNKITFEYVPFTTAKITVNYYDMDGTSIGDSVINYVEKGDTFTVQNNAPEGFVYHHAYLDGTQTAPQPTYQITGNEGDIIINIYYQKKLIILANNKAKTYDGKALASSFAVSTDYTVTGLSRGDTLTNLEFDGSQTNAGSSTTTPKNAKITQGATGIVLPEEYYNIIYVPGSLTVKPASVYISISADQWNLHSGSTGGPNYYTGQTFNVGFTNPNKQHFNDDNSKSAYINITSGQRDLFKAKYGTAIWSALYGTNGALITEKDAGTYTVTGAAQKAIVAGVTVDGQNIMSDPNYSVTINARDSFLTIVPLPLNITTPSAEKVYDGTPLTKSDGATLDHSYWTANIGGEWATAATAAPGSVILGTGDTITFNVTGSQTPVGSSENSYSIDWGDAKSSNYKINASLGTLTVTATTLKVTVNDVEKTYTGQQQSGRSFSETPVTGTGEKIETDDYVIEGLGIGDVLTVSYTPASGTQAATYTNGAFNQQYTITNNGEDVSANYNTKKFTPGKLIIKKGTVTITADSDSKVYDGTALTKNSYTNTDLATGDSIESVTVTGSQTVVGKSDNVPSDAKIVNAAGEDVTASYEITYTNGSLEVTKKAVTITADSDTKAYDGTPLTKNSYTNTALAAGDKIDSVTVNGSQTIVGSSNNVPSAAKIVNKAGEDVTASYAITYANGSLEVTKKAVTITAGSGEKAYDGTPLTKNSYTNTDLAKGDKIDSVTVTGSQTVVGTSNNVPSAAVIKNAAGEDVTEYYNITYANGTLEVTAKAVTITADSDTKVYDGTALTKNSYTKTDLAEGDSIKSVTVTGSQTVVGKSNNVPSAAKIVNAAGDDVTASYEITYANGTLEVTKKAVTITADSDTKVYDGTALTKVSYTNTGLAAGDKIDSVTVTGSQTVVGSSNNVPSGAVIKNAAGEDVTESYEITYKNGTLEVTKKAVTITAGSDTKVYDGIALTKDSYTNTALAEGDSIESVTVTGSQTVVGSSNNVPSTAVIKNTAGVDVTASYEITYANGTLEVTKKAVTITAGSDTKVYDGIALTKDSYTNTALAEGDSIESVTVTGSQTVVGSSNNVPSTAVIKNTAGVDVTASYEITYANGTLEVTKKNVTITADSDTKVYDGSALTKDSYTNTDLAAGDSIESVTVTGSQTVVGSSDNVPSAAVIKNGAGEDVTASYEITYTNGTLEVTEKTVTITADSDTKVYDGTALTKDSYTNTALAEGDSIDSVTVTGSQTVVGYSDNVPSAAKIVNAKGEDVTDSYTITYVNGTLEVTKKTVTITADSDTKVYDGTALTKNSYTNTALATGDKIDGVTVTGSQTVVGKSNNVPSAAKITNAAGEDVTASYAITYASGSLEVTKKAVTITADSDTKVYDGTALTKDSYTNTALAEGDSIESVIVTGSQTIVGKSDNVPSAAKIINNAGEDVTASYEITYVNGTLAVTLNQALIITADSDTKVYDGTALTKNSYKVSGLAEGDKVESVTVTGSQTVVGSSNNVPSAAKIVNAAGEDVTASYKITYANGTLEVTKKALTITADSDTKVYDGTALTKDSYTNTALAAGDSIESVTVTGSQTVVGSSNNVPSAAKIVNAADEDVTASYEITYANGSLEVTKKAVTITAGSDTKVYDGVALTKNSYTNTDLAAGDKIDGVTVTGSQTVVGKSDNEPSAAKIVNAAGVDVTASYDITYANGTLEVTKKTVTITADSDTKVYDGTALTKNSYTNTDLAAGDSIESVTVTGSQTEVGSSDNVPSAAKIVNAAGVDVTASYQITYANGTLEVTQKTVTITADSDTKVYDGTALTKNSYTNTALAEGDSIESITVTGSQTVVGSSENVPSEAKIVNAKGDDVTDSYTITYANGTLKVTQKTVTITADSDTKVYDGTALTKNSYTNTALAEGDSINSVTVTGSQTEVGSSDNVPSAAKITNAAGVDVTESYTISYVNGTLEVTKRPVTLTSATDSKVYDGTALTNGKVTVGGDGFVTGEGATYDVTGTQTAVGSSPNAFTYTLNEGTKAANYEITKTEGTLTVTELTDKVTVTITENSGSEKYDGSEKTVTGYTVSINNELYTEADFTFSGNATVKGTDARSYPMELKASDFTNTSKNFKNVEFVIVDGTLEISKRTVSLTSADDEKVYDGTALTNDKVTVGGDGFAEGEGAAYDVTGTQTAVGSSANAFTYTLNEGTKAANYTITTTEGTLKVTELTDKVTVTITENSGSEKYDGNEKTVTGYTVSIDNELYKEADFTFSGNATVKGTDAGSYPMELKPEDFTNTNENFSNVEFVIKDGTLKISKRTVSLTSADDEKVYDGTALTNDKVTVGGDGFAEGEGAAYDVTGTQTAVGSSANAFTYTLNEGTKAANYTITTTEGTLKVTELTDKVTVTITENSGSEKYDGNEKTVTGYTVSIDNELYKEADFTFSGNATVKGTDAGSYPMELKPEDFTNTNENFSNVEFVIKDGTLKISKRTVSLTSADDEKVYDGTALTNDKVTVGGDGFAEGEGATYDVTGTQTAVGSSPNAFTYTLNEGTKAANYEITKTEGTLKVTELTAKVTVTITENSGSEKYDGTEKTVTGYTVSIDNELYKEADFTFSGNATVKGTDAGNYPMELKPEDFTNKSANFTNVEFVIKDGTLEISKRTVTLTSADDEKVYDGTALTNDEVTVGGDGFAKGEGATYDVTGTQTAVGSSPNAFTYTLNEGTKAANYEITKTEGTLKVTELTDKVTVTIKENSGTEKYDGSEKTVTGYTVSISNKLYTEADFTFSGDATVKGTDAGSYPMELKASDFTNTNKNFSNVEFVIEDGTLEISKRTVTLTSATDEKVYDGKALTNDEVAVGGDGFATGEGATYDVTGTQTEVGESKNSFTYTLNEGTKATNYTITTTEGTLKVTELTDKVTVTIKENSGTEKYDGSEKTVTGYTVSISNKLYTEADFTFSGDATVKGTDAGSYPMELKASDFTNTNGNFSNVEFVIKDGTLEIAKRSVTLTSATDSKEYDGTALTNDEVTVGGDGFAKGEGATYDVTGTQTAVGSSPNAFTYTLNEGTKAANYEITKTEGTLKVTELTAKVTVTITENSGSEKYDGTEKTVTGYTVSIDNELYKEADFTFSGNATVKGTDAGNYPMELKPEDFTNKSANFTNVEFVIKDGTLEISKRTVTLTSADDEKVYDGTALTNDEVTVGGDGFAKGEGATYDVTGTQTAVGSSPNAFTYTLNEGTKAANYEITKTEGTLKVTELTDKVTVTIKENSGTEKYDGSEKTVTGYTVSISNKLYTEADFTFSGNATAKGTDAGSYPMELKASDFTNTNKNFSNVEFVIVDGTLEISKRTVTLTSADDKKVYDGTALTNGEVTVGGDGFATGEGATYDVTGTQTEVGESENTFTYTLNEGTKAGNYTITTTEGILKVTELTDKVTVTITENSGSEKYDGTEKTVTGYTVSIDNELYTEADFTFSGDATVKGTDAGSYPMELKASDFKNTNGNFSNVEFVIKDGTLEIAKRSVTLTSATDSKEYDGTALTNGKVTVSGDGFAEGEGAAYNVTGTITLVGSEDNTFEYTLNSGTKAENYAIETVFGKLTIIDRETQFEITVEANSADEKYDRTEKKAEGFTTLDFEVNGNTYSVSGLRASVSGTDAGTYTNTVNGKAVVKDAAGNDVTAQFVVKTKNGKLTISKRKVTLTSATDSKEYDGKALTNKEVTVSGDGFVEGEGATYNVTGSQLTAGSSANTFTYELNEGTKAANYEIEPVEGKLTVTDRNTKYEITVEANSAEAKYDGQEHTAEGFKKLTFEVEGNTYTVSGLSASVSGNNAGEYTNSISGTAVVKDAAENDVTKQFSVIQTNGKLTISKRVVTLTSATDEKTYDGKALTNDEITVGGDGFVAGEGAAYSVTGSQILVGTSENYFTYQLNEGTLADNYAITTANGTLTVKSRDAKYEIEVEANSAEAQYNGKEHTAEGFKTLSFEIDGNEYTVSGLTASVTQTDAGEYPVNVTGTAVVKDASGNDVTSQFAVGTKSGTLKITKRSVVLTSADGEKQYDGSPLTKNEQTDVTVSGDGFAEGEGATYNITGTRTQVGESENTFTYTLNSNTKETNYEIETAFGKLTITKGNGNDIIPEPGDESEELDAESKSITVVYDGASHTVGASATKDGSTIWYQYDGGEWTTTPPSRTDVGTTSFAIKATNPDYEDVVKDGYTLTVTPKAVTVTADDQEKKYGEDDPELTVKIEGRVSEEDEIKYEISRAEGETVEGSPYTITPTGEEEQGNYTVTYKTGELTITKGKGNDIVPEPGDEKEAIDLGSKSITVEYDGKSHTVGAKADKDGSTIWYQYDGGEWTQTPPSRTDVGSTSFAIKATNPDYEDVVKDGYTLTVTPKAVTVTADDQTKVFGETDPELTVTIDGRVSEEDEIKYEISREAGETVEGSPYTITPSGEKEQGNYTVTYKTGKLTITEGSGNDVIPEPGDENETLDAEGKSITVEYDGKSHTVGARASKEGSTIWYQYDGGEWTQTPPSRIDAGTTIFAIKATNPDYEDVVKEGYKLTVTPLGVTVTVIGNTGSKPYDGTVLNVTGYKLTISNQDGKPAYTENDFEYNRTTLTSSADKGILLGLFDLLFGEPITASAANVVASASRTEVGRTYMGLKKEDFSNLNKNFNPTFVVTDGYAEITSVPTPPTPTPTPTPEPTIIVPEIPSGNVLGANRIDPEIPLADGGRVLGASRAQTGDESNLLLWILLMLASAAGMGVVYRKARKEKESNSNS